MLRMRGTRLRPSLVSSVEGEQAVSQFVPKEVSHTDVIAIVNIEYYKAVMCAHVDLSIISVAHKTLQTALSSRASEASGK